MRALPSGDWPGKFSVTHALPRALNRSIVLRNHSHAGTVPARQHPCGCPRLGAPPDPEGSVCGGKQQLLPKEPGWLLPPSALAARSSQPAPSERLSVPWHPGEQTQRRGSRAYVCSLSKQVGKKRSQEEPSRGAPLPAPHLPACRVHGLFSFPLKSPHQAGSGKLNLCAELWVYYC